MPSAIPRMVGIATDQPTSPNMPSPNQTLCSPLWRASSFLRTRERIRSSSSSGDRGSSSGSSTLVLPELPEASDRARLHSGDRAACAALVLVDLTELLGHRPLERLELRSPRSASHGDEDVVSAFHEDALVDRHVALGLVFRLPEGEESGDEARDEIDVAGEKTEGSVLRLGRHTRHLGLEYGLGRGQEDEIHWPTSSMLPIMKRSCSVASASSSARIRSQPSMVSSRETILPGFPVKCSVVKKGCVRKRSRRRARLTVRRSLSESSSMPSIAMMSRSSSNSASVRRTCWATR